MVRKYINYNSKYSDFQIRCLNTEAATGGVLYEKVFFEILQNSHKTPVSESLFL